MEARGELARRFDVVVMAASAGGVQALETLLARLPKDFPLPIAIVQHRSTRDPNLMARVFRRHTALNVKIAEEGEGCRPARCTWRRRGSAIETGCVERVLPLEAIAAALVALAASPWVSSSAGTPRNDARPGTPAA